MASGSIGAEELPRLKHNRWSENSKVYTRKIHRVNKNKSNNSIVIPTVATTNSKLDENRVVNDIVENSGEDGVRIEKNLEVVVTDDNPGTTASTHTHLNEDRVVEDDVNKGGDSGDRIKDNDKVDGSADSPVATVSPNTHLNKISVVADKVDEPGENGDRIENHVIDITEGSDEENVDGDRNKDGNENIQQESSPPRVAAEEANSVQPVQNSARLETVSVDSSSLDRPQGPVPNGYDHEVDLANGLVRPRPIVNRVDDRVNISVSASSSRREIRELKRKLEGELDEVKRMRKRLRVKEAELDGYSNDRGDLGSGGHVGVTSAPVGSFQYPVNGAIEKGLNGGLMLNTDLGSVDFNGSRPFRRLSVSVMDNHGINEIVEKEKRTPKANQYYRNSEFLLGKERLPPAESNKKSKSAGGRRHGGRAFGYGYGIDKQLFKRCSNVLQKLINHKHGWVFREPVDVKKLGLHDYFDIIKHPMDLGTVKTRLADNWYKTPREFAEDVRLTFHNAMTYNPDGQDVNIMAKELLRIFEEKWPAIEAEYDHRLRYEMIHDIGVRTPSSRKSYPSAHVPMPMPFVPAPILHLPSHLLEARHLERSQSMPIPPQSRSKPVYSVGRTPAPKKPKAKDPHKRDMTFEEKQRLSTNLQSLPSEKLDAIVQIIKKRNSALSQHDDEIEVDIDSVDAETLWELDRFVTNYKKNLSKHKRKAELALQKAAAAQAVQETIPPPANNEATNDIRQDHVLGEGNVASSPHVQQERQGDNDSSSSSSSGSSSDSGSSSSDSDSDTSSGSDSDGGQ